MDALLQFDLALFRLINNAHSGALDVIFYWASNKYIWIPLYAFLLYKLIQTFKKKAALPIVLTIVMIVVSDQGSNFVKNSVERFRPCRTEAQLNPPARTLDNYHCSQHGFFSAHASNSFALLVFISLLLKKSSPKIWMLLLPYAFLNAYSRIYLGVHFPLDIICGALFGSLIAYLNFLLLSTWKGI